VVCLPCTSTTIMYYYYRAMTSRHLTPPPSLASPAAASLPVLRFGLWPCRHNSLESLSLRFAHRAVCVFAWPCLALLGLAFLVPCLALPCLPLHSTLPRAVLLLLFCPRLPICSSLLGLIKRPARLSLATSSRFPPRC
jgi:hypothetical protein